MTAEQPDIVEQHTLQLAMFTQARDARQWGLMVDGVAHPTWPELDPVAVEEYLQDARMFVGAMLTLGWAPGADALAAVIEQAKAEAEDMGDDAVLAVLEAADTDAALHQHDESVRQEVYRTVNLHPHAAANVVDSEAERLERTGGPQDRDCAEHLRRRAAAIRESRDA